jgi:hypothetical protein
MHIIRRFVCFYPLSFLFLGSVTWAQTGTVRPVVPPGVKIGSVTKVFVAKDSPAYLVSYSYNFEKLHSVYIEGIGIVSGKGSFQYLSTAQELEFRDPTTDAVLERVPLKETAAVAAKPPLNEVPTENQFPPGYRSYTWELPISLQDRANTVLAKYFNYQPHENDKLTYLATTYTPLVLDKKLTEKGIQAQVALLLSFPYDSGAGKFSFHIQYLAKEGRALSDELRLANNGEILAAAKDFVDGIVAAMKSKGE